MSHYFDFTQKAMDYREVAIIFELHGVKIPETQSWGKIRELKHLTNTIKHADADSAEKLRKYRPDFFTTGATDYPMDSVIIYSDNPYS